MKFVARVREIEAEQYTEANPLVPGVCTCPPRGMTIDPPPQPTHVHTGVFINGQEALLAIEYGDWIISRGADCYEASSDAVFRAAWQEPASYPGEASQALYVVRRLELTVDQCCDAFATGAPETLDETGECTREQMIEALNIHVKQLKCPHEQHACFAKVARVTDGENGPVTSFMCDLIVWCTQCDVPFHFSGFPWGASLNAPSISINGVEARLPIMPGPLKIPTSGEARFQM